MAELVSGWVRYTLLRKAPYEYKSMGAILSEKGVTKE